MKYLVMRCSDPNCHINFNVGMVLPMGCPELPGMRDNLELQANSHVSSTGHEVTMQEVFRR